MNPTESTFTCSYQGHENEPIVSFCVNLKCKDQFQCCSQCLVKKHQDHRDNCQTIIQVNQIIRKGIVEIPQWKSQSKQVFQKVSQIYQVFAKLLSVEQNKLIQLEKQMKKEDFYLEYKDFIQIKYNNKIQRLFSKIQEKNYCIIIIKQISCYLLNLINEMQKFEETLLSFGFFSSKSSRNQSQLNRESEILNIDEKRSQLLEHNIDIICQNKNCSNFRQYCKYCKLYNNQNISLFSVIESNIEKQIVTISRWMSQAMQAFEKIQELFTIIQFALEAQETQFKELEKFLLEQDLHQFMNQKKNLKQWVKLRELYCLIQQKAKLPILLNKLELLSQTLQSQSKNDYLEIMNLNQNLLKKRVNLDDENEANEALSLANYLCRDEKQDINISWFDRAIDINPYNFEAFYNKGHALSRLNRYEESINCFDRAICLNPNYPEAYYNIGFALNSLNRYEEALKFFDQAIKIKNNYLEAFINKGEIISIFILQQYPIQIDMKRLQYVIIKQQRQILNHLWHLIIKVSIYQIQTEMKKLFYAQIRHLTQTQTIFLHQQIEAIICFLILGNALRSLNQNESAIKCYEQEININPKHYLSYLNKGLTLCNLNRYQEGIKCYDQAIQLNSKSVEILNKKGLALENQNLLKEALNCYDQAIKINPNYSETLNFKGKALQKLNRFEEAIQFFDQAIKLNPTFSEALNNKGSSLDDLSKYDQALQCFDQAIQFNPTYSEAFNNKGICLYKQLKELLYLNWVIMNKPSIVLIKQSALTQITIKHSTIKIIIFTILGFLLDNLGLYEDAITQYDQAININPKYSNAIHNKSEAQKKRQKCMIPIFPKKGLRAQQPQKIIYNQQNMEEREIDLGAAKFSQHD